MPLFWGVNPQMEQMLANGKAWMDNFDEISYTDSKWFPGLISPANLMDQS